ncbi:MAG: molybdopterin molybdotransferase MoeA [Bacteroidetes bacterium]|nr:molybdopterin molybdotransferase MoeA [Bacteroidota bacterium]
MNTMISFENARRLVIKNTRSGRVMSMKLSECLHHVLAENIVAIVDAPPFDQSAMDGFAFNVSSWDKNSPLLLTSVIQAGKKSAIKLKKHEAAKIFTGAPIPSGANCVVMKEKVLVKGNQVFILDVSTTVGLNIRRKAFHVKAGKVVLKKGDIISAGTIAFLASIGIAQVKVFAKPRIGIIVTGDELAVPGKKLKSGQVYECNSFGLIASLLNYGIIPDIVLYAKDDRKDVKRKLMECEKKSDIILFTGGVSVGDFDFVASTLDEHKVKMHFHKVKQKPGKPIYFGSKKDKVYFGLPGNPASVLTCFHVYVVDAIYAFMNKSKRELIPALSLNDYRKKPGMANFLKAKQDVHGVAILKDQESYKLNSFVDANVLLVMKEDESTISRDDKVEVIEIRN